MPNALERRTVLKGSTGLIAATLASQASAKKTKLAKESPIDASYSPSGKGVITGKGVGDFDFLSGEWRIRHLRLKDGTKDEWQRFDSGAKVTRVLGGMGSIEELRKADGGFLGMGVRIWLPQEKKWADHWTSAWNGVVGSPQLGEFIDGEGVFLTEEVVDAATWQYRGVWDKVTRGSCRWHQSKSSDGGKSWEWNWWMEWTRRR